MPNPADVHRQDADLSLLRRRITELVANNAVAMVQNAIDAVNEDGQYQAIKYLFEMIGLYPVSAGDEDAADDSLATILLQRLDLKPEDEQSGSTPAASEAPVQ